MLWTWTVRALSRLVPFPPLTPSPSHLPTQNWIIEFGSSDIKIFSHWHYYYCSYSVCKFIVMNCTTKVAVSRLFSSLRLDQYFNEEWSIITKCIAIVMFEWVPLNRIIKNFVICLALSGYQCYWPSSEVCYTIFEMNWDGQLQLLRRIVQRRLWRKMSL